MVRSLTYLLWTLPWALKLLRRKAVSPKGPETKTQSSLSELFKGSKAPRRLCAVRVPQILQPSHIESPHTYPFIPLTNCLVGAKCLEYRGNKNRQDLLRTCNVPGSVLRALHVLIHRDQLYPHFTDKEIEAHSRK